MWGGFRSALAAGPLARAGSPSRENHPTSAYLHHFSGLVSAVILIPDFFERSTLEVAPELLGAVLCVRANGAECAGRIVEVEAYLGEDDLASHAGRGRTPRSEIMFGEPGIAYVYLIYGVHHCLNFVTEGNGTAGAVLIRALEPLSGRKEMAHRRGLDPARCSDREIASGPGKLCAACGIDLAWNGLALRRPRRGRGWIVGSRRAKQRPGSRLRRASGSAVRPICPIVSWTRRARA